MIDNIQNSGLKEFTIKCLTDCWIDGGKTAGIINEHWEAADNLSDFKEAVFEDERLRLTQAYAELSKEDDDHWCRVREMFGDRCFKTISDIGGVKVGNDTFFVVINNEIGDGTTRVAVFHKGSDFNDNMMNFSGTTLKGKFNVYDYDCGNTPILELNGNYLVYCYQGLVAFVEF